MSTSSILLIEMDTSLSRDAPMSGESPLCGLSTDTLVVSRDAPTSGESPLCGLPTDALVVSRDAPTSGESPLADYQKIH